uniref:Uncharacterized protein n=1 Tax=Tanacetum cinerariifolium TaxID=118510 RepID=A0A6L2LCU4_TANCI|nr:hypothetical protein [Tanacetum cinerariifolium]
MDDEIRESYRTLEDRLFHKGRFVTLSFIEQNNILPPFQAIGLESFLKLDKPICPCFVTEFYHSLEVKRSGDNYPYIEFKLGTFTFQLSLSILSRIFKTPSEGSIFYTHEWSLNSLDTHFNNRLFSLEREFVKQAITIPRTTNRQLQGDQNILFHDDLHSNLQGWELFIRENVISVLGNRDHVNACTVYMLYYLKIQKKFNLTAMILLRMKDFKKSSYGSMPYDMLLTRLFKHILQSNLQSIVSFSSFTYYERVVNPLDISRKIIRDKGKRATPPSSSSSSSSSDEKEESSFMEFYDELFDNEDLTDAQKRREGCLNT